jgi:hypothetical protein
MHRRESSTKISLGYTIELAIHQWLSREPKLALIEWT